MTKECSNDRTSFRRAFELRASFVIRVWELVIPRGGVVWESVIPHSGQVSFLFVFFAFFVVKSIS
jgi:hypothetical protein